MTARAGHPPLQVIRAIEAPRWAKQPAAPVDTLRALQEAAAVCQEQIEDFYNAAAAQWGRGSEETVLMVHQLQEAAHAAHEALSRLEETAVLMAYRVGELQFRDAASTEAT